MCIYEIHNFKLQIVDGCKDGSYRKKSSQHEWTTLGVKEIRYIMI